MTVATYADLRRALTAAQWELANLAADAQRVDGGCGAVYRHIIAAGCELGEALALSESEECRGGETVGE